MSPATNRRVDEYGGSEENRSRVMEEIIKGIRAKCGKEFIIGTTLGAFDFCDGGYDFKEGKRIAKRLERAGLNYINLSYGIPGPVDPSRMIETQKYDDGNRLKYVEELKQTVDLPVVLVGKLKSPRMCDEIIGEGRADFVAIGRQAIADPDWVLKASEGRSKEIKACLSCNDGCLKALMSAKEIKCAINPVVGKEYLKNGEIKPKKNKKVLIVGSGPAGVQASITASENGHIVTLVEKKDSIGGQLSMASTLPNKDIINDYIKWSEDELSRKNINVIMGTKVNKEFIKKENPDVVLIATGSKPIDVNIPGANHLVNSWCILDEVKEIPKNKVIAIIGGGIVGCETAHLLAKNRNRVTIFETKEDVSVELEDLSRLDLLTNLNRLGVVIKTSTTVIETKEDGVVFNNKEGDNQFMKAEKIIASIGQVPIRDNLAEDIRNELNIQAKYIGDALEVGNIIDAVHMGYKAGMNI
jgi:thioredoxin reductase